MKKLERLREQNEVKKLTVQNHFLDRKIRSFDARAQYDAVSGSEKATGAGNKRRQSSVETKEETGAMGLLKPYDRLKTINLARDAERNFSGARSILNQLKVNVIGSKPKAQINTRDDFGQEATAWINKKWMKNCDFSQTRRFAKLAQLLVAAKAREGDLLVLFDDEIITDSGKLLFYESDLICDVTGVEAQSFKEAGYTQHDGIVCDKYGREVGYVVSKRRGQTVISSEDAVIFRRDPENEDKNMVKLIRSEFRIKQHRGISPMLSAIGDILDSYEMRTKELQSAKAAASMLGTVKRSEAIEDFDDPRLDPDNENPDDSAGNESTLPEDQSEPANYERLEAGTGGYMDYLAEGDEFTLHNITRPNVHMKEFLDYVMDSSGSAFGMAHAYTRLKADTSYTAFRGDMILSWVSFYAEQKDIENEFLDWAVIRAVRWAIRKGIIKSAPPEDWEDKISWKLPTIPFVDEVKERTAHALGLKNGELTFAELLGPDWESKFVEFAAELEAARKYNLPLSVFESKSGGMSEITPENNGDDNEQD